MQTMCKYNLVAWLLSEPEGLTPLVEWEWRSNFMPEPSFPSQSGGTFAAAHGWLPRTQSSPPPQEASGSAR